MCDPLVLLQSLCDRVGNDPILPCFGPICFGLGWVLHEKVLLSCPLTFCSAEWVQKGWEWCVRWRCRLCEGWCGAEEGDGGGDGGTWVCGVRRCVWVRRFVW